MMPLAVLGEGGVLAPRDLHRDEAVSELAPESGEPRADGRVVLVAQSEDLAPRIDLGARIVASAPGRPTSDGITTVKPRATRSSPNARTAGVMPGIS
jgi:hypothetical protein